MAVCAFERAVDAAEGEPGLRVVKNGALPKLLAMAVATGWEGPAVNIVFFVAVRTVL